MVSECRIQLNKCNVNDLIGMVREVGLTSRVTIDGMVVPNQLLLKVGGREEDIKIFFARIANIFAKARKEDAS